MFFVEKGVGRPRICLLGDHFCASVRFLWLRSTHGPWDLLRFGLMHDITQHEGFSNKIVFGSIAT